LTALNDNGIYQGRIMNIHILERIREEISRLSYAKVEFTATKPCDTRLIVPTGADNDQPIIIGEDASDIDHAKEILLFERKATGYIPYFHRFYGFAHNEKIPGGKIYFNLSCFRNVWHDLVTDYTDERPIAEGATPEDGETLIGYLDKRDQGNFFHAWGVAPSKDWQRCVDIINIPGEIELNYRHYNPIFLDPVWDAWIFAVVFDDLTYYKRLKKDRLEKAAKRAINRWNPALIFN